MLALAAAFAASTAAAVPIATITVASRSSGTLPTASTAADSAATGRSNYKSLSRAVACFTAMAAVPSTSAAAVNAAEPYRPLASSLRRRRCWRPNQRGGGARLRRRGDNGRLGGRGSGGSS